MSHTIEDLRTHLFDTLAALKSKTDPMDIERAKAVAEVAQCVINSAKVEVDHMKIAGGSGSGFLGTAEGAPARKITHTPTGVKTVEGGVTRHRLT